MIPELVYVITSYSIHYTKLYEGEGILLQHGLVYNMLTSMNKEGINAKIISGGASDVAAYVVIESADRNRAINVIHNGFFRKIDV